LDLELADSFEKRKTAMGGREEKHRYILGWLAISNGERSSRRILIKGGDTAQMRTTVSAST
jgi:hypothetical protein